MRGWIAPRAQQPSAGNALSPHAGNPLWSDVANMPEWRNGRRKGLKLPGPSGRVGSIPTSGMTPGAAHALGVPAPHY